MSKQVSKQLESLVEFQYFQRTEDPKSSIGLKGFEINVQNQLLFYDLQLMFLNQHLPPATWNEDIQRNVGVLIDGLIQKRQDPSLRLKDLYFEVTQKSLQLHILTNKENYLKENNIITELECFGSKIKKLGKFQTLKNFSLQELVQSALNIYGKIKFQISYKSSIYDEMIKRYVIEQILLNSQQSTAADYIYDKESTVQEIFMEYYLLLRETTSKTQGNFFITSIFCNSLNEIQDQLLFFKNLKQTTKIKMDNWEFNYSAFNDKIQLFLEDRGKFKKWALSWVINQTFQQQNVSADSLLVLKSFFQNINAKFIKEYLSGKNSFCFLNNLQNQYLLQNEVKSIQQEQFEKNYLIQQINSILQTIIQNKKISTRIQNLLNFSEIPEQILSILTMSRIAQLPNLNYLNEGELFDIIEYNFLKQILDIHYDRIIQFYSVFQRNQNISKETLKENLLKAVKNETLSISFAIIQLHSSIKLSFRIIDGKDYLVNDLSLQKFPDIIKQFIIESFKSQRKISFSDYAAEQVNIFQPQLENYSDYVKKIIAEEIQTISIQFKDSGLEPQLIKIAKNKEPQIFQKLLNLFIPFVDIEEYVQYNSFLVESRKIIAETLTFELKELLQFHRNIISFIHEKIEFRKQIFNFQDSQIKEIEKYQNNLCVKFTQKVLNGQFDKPSVSTLNSEKQSHEFDINSYFTKLIEEALIQIFIDNEQKRLQEKEQIRNAHNFFCLPFTCIENKIEELINNQQQEEMNLYLERLQQFTSQVREQVERTSKIYQRVINFGFTDKKQEIIENQIAEWMGSSYQQLDIDIIQPEAISKQIVIKIDEYYNWSEQEMTIKIKEKQQTDISDYLEELFGITKQQCELILIHPIKLDQINFNQLQEFQTGLDKIVLEAENEINLKNRSFEYFKEHILNQVLQGYQEQIENHLKQIQF